MGRILLVEDDQLIAVSLARALRARGFDVDVAATLSDAANTSAWDLMLCDLGLPDGDGLDLISACTRRDPTLPIIALTARADESDVIAALASGAIDYITKPFRLAELLARIDGQFRLRAALTEVTSKSSTINVGDLTIDPERRQLMVGDVEVALRRREFDVLLQLARSPGHVVRRTQLIKEIWGDEWWGSTKTLDVHVNSIRRKIGEQPGEPSRITPVRGVGYRLDHR